MGILRKRKSQKGIESQRLAGRDIFSRVHVLRKRKSQKGIERNQLVFPDVDVAVISSY